MTELTPSQRNTRPSVGAPCLQARGATINTSGTSAYVAIPLTASGASPNAVRLATTAACYARLGLPTEASVVDSAAGSGYLIGDTITVSGGTFSSPMILSVTTSKLATVALNALGSGYDISDVITLDGGTAATKATITLSHLQFASATLNAAGTGYVPGQVITTASTGSTASSHATITVTTTKVISATVAAAGASGSSDGSGKIVTGTTGTGTKFQASVTVTGGAIASVDSISVAGHYTTNPTLITSEPVTGDGLVGAALSVVIGVDTFAVTTRGDYTVKGTAITQNGATSPSGGTGFTASSPLWGPLTWTYSNAGDYSATVTALTQAGAPAPASGGTGATFQTALYGVKTATVSDPGAYSVDPTNPAASTSTTGNGATFTCTFASAAAAGDILVTPEEAVTVDAVGFDHVAAIQVASGGVFQVSPLEN